MTWNLFFTLVDMVGPVLTRWTRFWPNMTVLTRNGLKLIFYPGRHGLTRIDSVDSVLTRNGLKLIFYPGRHGLTRIDPVESVLMERCGWLEQNIFLNFKLFLNFFWIFINNTRNKITFKKILVNPKLGYNTDHNQWRESETEVAMTGSWCC
jgi:hypothetical protein